MRFSQKTFLFNRATFAFGDRHLNVAFDDGRLAIGFAVAYNEISTRHTVERFPENAFRYFALVVLGGTLAAAIFLWDELPQSGVTAIGFFVLAAMLLWIASFFAKFDATRIPVASGHTILVFHDSQHQIILNEIDRRRKSEILCIDEQVDAGKAPTITSRQSHGVPAVSMKFQQKKTFLKTILNFGEDELAYVFSNTFSKHSANFRYDTIPATAVFTEIRLWWLRYFLVFYCTLCLVTILTCCDINDRMLTVLYYATLGFFGSCLLAFILRRPGVSTFSLHPPLIVLHDGQQAEIFIEIALRRSAMRARNQAGYSTIPFQDRVSPMQ